MDTIAINTIADELIEASRVYYSGEGDSLMTDDDFDEKQAFLVSIVEEIEDEELASKVKGILETDSVTLGADIEISNEVTHNIPMLSLAKANSEKALKKFLLSMIDNGAKGFKVQLKLDGFALSAKYVDGKIAELATRGNGTVGENSSFMLTADDVTIVGLPRTIPVLGDVEIRGELFFTEQQFHDVDARRVALTGNHFKNSRNAVVGLRLKAQSGVEFPVEFSFAAYSAWNGHAPIELSSISAPNFDTVEELTLRELGSDSAILLDNLDLDATLSTVAALEPLLDNFSAPNDGVVVKPSNEAQMMSELGSTAHHPVSQMAYKYPTPTFPTDILSVSYSVGKTGKVTPRAHVVPTKVMGTLIGNVSLHNFAWIEERNIQIGSKVALTRANKVIPYIKGIILNPPTAVAVEIPETCPACGGELKSEDGIWPPKTLRCNDLDCPSRDLFSILNAVSKGCLNIDGMSGATVEYLNEIGKLNSIADLYTLTMEDLEDSTFGFSPNGNPRKLGVKRAQNILDHIEASKELPLQRVLMALSIQSLGNTASKLLVKEFGDLESIRNVSIEQISEIDGLGAKRGAQIVTGLQHRSAVIDKMLEAGVKFTVAESVSSGDTLDGLSFAISGPVPAPFANRAAWIEYVESNGGAFHSGPKAATSYMVADKGGDSSKVKKAHQLKVEFITADEFTAKFVS